MKNKNDDKVFCGECKYYTYYISWMGSKVLACKLTAYTHLTNGRLYYRYEDCKDKNEHNNCPDFRRKFSFWRWVKGKR